MTKQEKKIKRYVNAIERELRLPLKAKAVSYTHLRARRFSFSCKKHGLRAGKEAAMAAAVLTLLSLIYLGGLAALLCVAYSRRHFNRYTAVKAAVSCGFLVIAATAYLLGDVYKRQIYG